MTEIRSRVILVMSRSTWACELKYIVMILCFGYAWSRSTWACELKFKSFTWVFVNGWSRSTWACELKYIVMILCFGYAWSRSTWACELKLNIYCLTNLWPGHAPRERVSWNTLSNDILKTRTMSRSTWACELKYIHGSCGHTSPWSRSTWACELKCTFA